MLPVPSMSSTWSVRSPHRTGAASPWAGSNKQPWTWIHAWDEAPTPNLSNGVLPPCDTSLGHQAVHSMVYAKASLCFHLHPTNEQHPKLRKFDPKKSLLCKKALQKRCGDICAPAAPKQACWNAQKTFSTKPCRRWWGRVELTSQSIGISVAACCKP